MKSQARGIVQVLFLGAIAFLLLRLFPLVIRLSEVAALELYKFWWLVLGIALAGWLIWVLRKRNSG